MRNLFFKESAIPLVGSYHTDSNQYLHNYELQFLSKILWKYMRWFYRPCAKLFAPSKKTLLQLKHSGFTNLEIWPRGVDCHLFHPYYDKKAVRKNNGLYKKFLLTCVGRLVPEKDVNTIMEVAKSLPEEIDHNIDRLIVGDGPLREALQKEAPANMHFTGYLNGKKFAEIFSGSDLFISPSPTETFGNVVLKALASGTPVIGADSGGVKNIIKHGTNAILMLLFVHT